MISRLHTGQLCRATRPQPSVCCGQPMIAKGTNGWVQYEIEEGERHLVAVKWRRDSIELYRPEEIEIVQDAGKSTQKDQGA